MTPSMTPLCPPDSGNVVRIAGVEVEDIAGAGALEELELVDETLLEAAVPCDEVLFDWLSEQALIMTAITHSPMNL